MNEPMPTDVRKTLDQIYLESERRFPQKVDLWKGDTAQEKLDLWDETLSAPSTSTGETHVAHLQRGLYTVIFAPGDPGMPLTRRLVLQTYDTPQKLKRADYVTVRLDIQSDQSSFMPGVMVASFLKGPDNKFGSHDWQGFADFVHRADSEKFKMPVFRIWKRWQQQRVKGHDLYDVLSYLVRQSDDTTLNFGMISSRCGVCGRELTVPSSIEAGIGPVCAVARGIEI